MNPLRTALASAMLLVVSTLFFPTVFVHAGFAKFLSAAF